MSTAMLLIVQQIAHIFIMAYLMMKYAGARFRKAVYVGIGMWLIGIVVSAIFMRATNSIDSGNSGDSGTITV